MVSNKLSHSGIGGKGKLSLEVSNQMSLITPQQGRNITVMIILEGERKKGNDDLPERSNPSSSSLAARFDSSVTLLLTTMAFVIVPIMPRIMSTNSSRILMREEETGPGILGRAGEPSKVFDNGQRHLSL
jgi:hypothetical protein